ncbi:MAG TPA: hypothetical protein VF151_10950 [Gemmatimonadales bacterium]
MFQLKDQAVHVTHINQREEKHGSEGVLAIDLKISCDVPKSFCAQIAPQLPEFMYDGETLRFPQLEALKVKVGIKEATLVLSAGTKKSEVAFVVDIKTAMLDPKEGGTVELSFQAATNPTPDQVGKVSALLGAEKSSVCTLHLNDMFPPKAGEGGEGKGDDDGDQE